MRSWRECKEIISSEFLGAHKSTHSVVLEGDLGLSRLRKDRLIRMVKFWIKILRSKNRLAKEAYFSFLEDKIEVGWPQEMKKILDEVGYSYFRNECQGSN